MNAAFNKLTPTEKDKLVDDIAHCGDGEMRARQEYGLEVTELEEFMLDHGYERCPKCEWFVECSELLDDNNQPTVCSNCV